MHFARSLATTGLDVPRQLDVKASWVFGDELTNAPPFRPTPPNPPPMLVGPAAGLARRRVDFTSDHSRPRAAGTQPLHTGRSASCHSRRKASEARGTYRPSHGGGKPAGGRGRVEGVRRVQCSPHVTCAEEPHAACPSFGRARKLVAVRQYFHISCVPDLLPERTKS